MVNLLFAEHSQELQGTGIIRSVLNTACGTGGMLITAKEHIKQNINSDVKIDVYGQESSEQTYAISKSDILISGENEKKKSLGFFIQYGWIQGKQIQFHALTSFFWGLLEEGTGIHQ